MEDDYFSKVEKLAYEKGFRVVNGNVINPTGAIRCTNYDSKGYERFTLFTGSKKLGTAKLHQVMVHRLVAFQKFGEEMYVRGLEVRHKDNDKKNNKPHNILLGTHSQNLHDLPKKMRKAISINASTNIRRFTDKEVLEIRQYYSSGKSYKDTMTKFNISSKGSLHFILNNKYQTKK